MTNADSPEPRVVVWMREASPPPDDPRRTVVSRLRELEAEDVVDDVTVRVWGKYVQVSDEENDQTDPPVRDRIATFRTWADREGHSLGPAFRRTKQSSLVSDDWSEVIQLPLQCPAVYRDDDLVGVFPCSTEDGTWTVSDCLGRLESGDLPDATDRE